MNRRFLQLHKVVSLRAVADRPATKAGAALSVAVLSFIGLHWDLLAAKLAAAIAGMTLPVVYLSCTYFIPRLARRVDSAGQFRPEPPDRRDSF